jgi:uncharacterized membrane protein
MADNSNAAGGAGLGTILFIVFLVLKLTNLIAWSWWWVTSPLWIPVAMIIVIVLLYIVFKGIENILN